MKFTNLRAFEKHLDDAAPKNLADIYMIIGKDRFTYKMAIDRLINLLVKDQKNPSLSLKSFNGAQCSQNELLSELQSFSFFSEKQVLWIDEADKLPKPIMKALEGYFKQPNPSLCLILSGASINHATNFYKHAEKIGVVLEFPEEKPADREKALIDWVNTKVASEKKKIDPRASQQLVKQVASDMALLHNELEKVFCYIGERSSITTQDISDICGSCNQENIWQLGEALFQREANAALRISKAFLAEGVPFLTLLRQIRNQFQTEYQVCSIMASGGNGNDITQQFPYMKGFILDRHMRNAQAYGMIRFKKGMKAIDDAELSAKNSMDTDILLERLIIQLIT